jgi:hypothetical protein
MERPAEVLTELRMFLEDTRYSFQLRLQRAGITTWSENVVKNLELGTTHFTRRHLEELVRSGVIREGDRWHRRFEEAITAEAALRAHKKQDPVPDAVVSRAAEPTLVLPTAAVACLVDSLDPNLRYDVAPPAHVGRLETNNIVLPYLSISRQHARITQESDIFHIYDLGSSNGTFVNGQRVTDSAVIKDGDRIRFGDVILVFKELN